MENRNLVYVLTGIAVSLIVVIGGLVLLLSSGGGGDGGNGGDSSPTLAARQQGELRLPGGDPITLDPACASDIESASYIYEIFSGLVGYDKELQLIPDIAERWDTSDDGTVYTFYLRTSVLFHDNSRRVTAGDFKFSMERALNPDTQSSVADVYLDDLVGVDEYIDGSAQEVSGIKVIDPDTLELTIKAADPVFLPKLSYPTAFVVDKNQVEGSSCFEASWTFKANGTGPFELAEWDLSNAIILEPNQNYYLDPKPQLSKVTYLLSGGSSFTMYQNDEIDVTGVGKDNVESVRDPSSDLNAEYHISTTLSVSYIGFNVDREPLNDPDVRRALAMAIDKEFLTDNLYKGLLNPANGILPPEMPGFNENLDGVTFDAEAASDLLDSTGKKDELDGIKILTAGQGAAPDDVLQAITAMWEQNLGISVEVEQEDFGLLQSDLQDKNFDMFSIGWIADYPDPQNFLEIKFHSGSSNNDTGYSNPDVDDLLDQASGDVDAQERIDLYQQAEQLIVDDQPWIPLFYGTSSILVKPDVKGYEAAPFAIPSLRYVSVDR
ncbi:MAG: peptide ABC transporter substrate-binding protein [Chloroflexota bacterium]